MKPWLAVAVLLPVAGFPQAFDSALAPYPSLHERYDPAVEDLLATVERNGSPAGALSATVDWTVESSKGLDLERQNFGPLSIKSCPNWHTPPEPGYWASGTYAISAQGNAFRIEKAADEAASADWWQKDGEQTYARAWSEDWPTIWRFHHDAFEAGMLGYPEGLGVLLWAFNAAEYLRRADHLELGEDREVAGRVYKTLVATPSWVKVPLRLENRTAYPFEESTLASWATLRPVVTYFVEPSSGLVAGASFVYHRVLRSGPKDWTAGSKPSGLAITCFAEEVGRTAGGTAYPTRIVGEVRDGDTLLRRTVLAVRLGAPESVPALALPAGKRKIDPWPKYRPEVYRAWLDRGDTDHANRLGLAASLAFEGTDVAAAEAAMLDAVAALETDASLERETFGGIDWELGFALYELFWRHSDAALVTFWDTVPRTDTWLDIVNRAADLHGTYRGTEHERTALVREGQALLYAQVREPDFTARCRAAYLADLQRRAVEAADPEEKAYLQGLAGEVAAQLQR